MEPLKPLEHKNLMPYVSDLSEHWQFIGGYCGLQREVEKLKQESDTADNRLSHLFYVWLERGGDTCTWAFFISIPVAVGKGKVVQKIEKDVFGTETQMKTAEAAGCVNTSSVDVPVLAETQMKTAEAAGSVKTRTVDDRQQWQIQYPIIDDLGDQFALLVAEVTDKVDQLEPRKRRKLRVAIEAKLKTKAKQESFFDESVELMEGISKYWDFLNFEIMQLVVKFLDDRELDVQLAEYEKSVQNKVTRTLEECKKREIMPLPPDNFVMVPLTLPVDAHRYSLHKVLQMKDFLVNKMGIDIAHFAGWKNGSVILYFYILEKDFEDATLRLKDPECLRRLCLELDVQNVEVGVCRAIVSDKFVEVTSQMQLEELRMLHDSDFEEAHKAMEVLRYSLNKWLEKHDLAIDTLKKYQEKLEKSYHKRTISKVAGASIAIVGSGLAITGFGLSFVTLGASLSLTIIGGAAAMAGGVTMGGADFGDLAKSRSIMKKAGKLVKDCDQIHCDMHESAVKVKASCENLSVKFPSFSEDQIFLAVSHNIKAGMYQAVKAAQVGSTFCHGGKLTSIGLLRTGVRLGGNTCTYTVGAARVAWAGLNTIAGGLSIAGVAIDIISVPLDSIVLIKGAYDIHKYRTGKGSNSKASKQIKKTIDQLTEGRQKLMEVQEAIGLLCSH